MSVFVPDDWKLTDKLRQYARDKRLTDATIDDQEEAFRLCQFNRSIKDFDRAWQRWIRSAIEWGKVQPTFEAAYTPVAELAPEERKEDAAKAVAQMDKYRRRG